MYPQGLTRRRETYYVQFKDRSGRFRKRSVGTDLAHALSEHSRLRNPRDPEVATFGELCERYLKRQETFSKAKSVRCARYSCATLLKHLGDRPVGDLGPEDLSEFISSRRRKVCANSVNADLRILRAVLRLGVEDGAIPALPFKIRMLRATPREVRLLSREDVQRLLAATSDPRIRLFLAVAAATGLRRDEILHLKWGDIDGDSITVRPKDGWESKTYERRTLYGMTPIPWTLFGA